MAVGDCGRCLRLEDKRRGAGYALLGRKPTALTRRLKRFDYPELQGYNNLYKHLSAYSNNVHTTLPQAVSRFEKSPVPVVEPEPSENLEE